jgi:STE24 endopeptidase
LSGVRVLLAVLALAVALPPAAKASKTPAPTVPARAAQNLHASAPSKAPESSAPAAYELSPSERARAIAYSHAQDTDYFLGVGLSILIYLVLWVGRVGVALRRLARSVSARHILQCAVFVPLLLGAAALLELPLDYQSGFLLEHRFGLSTEPLPAWLADWGKSLALEILAGIFLVWIFFLLVRRSPRRWWFYFWLMTVPFTLFIALIEPYVVEPLFFKFTPLEQKHPALVERIEQMLHHAGLEIPPSRVYEMNASAKTRELNAYVSGFGPSKRVVVWDTTLHALDADETLEVLGHETGHYVLHHIVKEFAWDELVTLLFLWLGFLALRWTFGRFGRRTALENEGDLASLPLILLLLTLLAFFSDPIVNAISRHYEHQADQFALEVTYGVVPDPNAAEAGAFQVLGRRDLSDPDPSPFIRFWLYSHPPIADRIRFAESYKPWAEGKPLELLHALHH